MATHVTFKWLGHTQPDGVNVELVDVRLLESDGVQEVIVDDEPTGTFERVNPTYIPMLTLAGAPRVAAITLLTRLVDHVREHRGKALSFMFLDRYTVRFYVGELELQESELYGISNRLLDGISNRVRETDPAGEIE